jgi:hypothetical protein
MPLKTQFLIIKSYLSSLLALTKFILLTMSSTIRQGGICARFTKRGPNPKALAMVVIRPPKTIASRFAVTSECIFEKGTGQC